VIAFDQNDWLTVAAASYEYQLPADFIEEGILSGQLDVRRVCGARVVRHSELAALAQQVREERGGACHEC
jgi:hypothetical protein